MLKSVIWILILTLTFIHSHLHVHCEASTFYRMLAPSYESNTYRRPYKIREDGLEESYFLVREGVMDGLELAVSSCKDQFQWDLWNCPVTANSVVTKATHSRVTKEISFLQAITAAGIMYSTTKTCTQQGNALCSCGNDKLGEKFSSNSLNWEWGGCSHNVKFGEKVSKSFLGTEAKSASIDQVLKSHNEKAGQRAVKLTLKTLCKCHGVTGACTMKTCWKTLSEFRLTAEHLRKKYKRSKDIRHMQGFTHNSNKVRHPRVTRISKNDLVYYTDSPNYCETDNSIGYLGTRGRECLKLEKGANKKTMKKFLRNSCKRLCKDCGHKIGKYVYEETYKCDCEFKWCCSVDCKTCSRKVVKYFCK